ncbi:MAG: peptide-methionine (S)-S-oxide reductase MsrA [Ahrensia sp.]|nr:peptide-methionine (S)-S-oxide reductase MsrA [Ahrensia sp.]
MTSFLTKTFLAASLMVGGTQFANAETKTIVLAGGCFWCVESDFDTVKGVTKTTSGFAGGTSADPTYKNHAGHREVVKIEYDSTLTDYKTLVTTFLRTIDPTDGGGQFCDRGASYAPGLFASNAEEKKIAEAVLAEASAELGKKLPVPVLTTINFGAADAYHLDYYKSSEKVVTRFGIIKKADAYKKYRAGCGRDAGVRAVWGDKAYAGVKLHS